MAELPEMVLELTVRVPPLSMPPPYTVAEAAAVPLRGGVAGEGAAADRQPAVGLVVDATAHGGSVGGVAGEGAAADRQRAPVVNARAHVPDEAAVAVASAA